MLVISLLLSFFSLGFSCQIAGAENGACMAVSDIKELIPFCAETLSGYVCVPQNYTLWSDFSMTYKDNQIQSTFMSKMVTIFLDEANNKEAKAMYLLTVKGCFTSYKKFVCNWNFPSCTPDYTGSGGMGTTAAVCMSLCQTYSSNCGLNSQLCNVNYDDDPGLDSTC